MIEITNVTKRYGRRVALSGVSLTLRPGDITLLLGANGAGKSTLLRCLLGITDYEGSIRVAGRDPLTHGREVRSLVGYMPQSGGLHLDLSVADTLRWYADIRRAPRERGEALLKEAGLSGHESSLVGDLSGGMRQRLGFALALLTDPAILVLDEPSSSLDAGSRQWLAERLRDFAAAGRIVLVSTHAGQDLLASPALRGSEGGMSAGHRRVVLEEGRVVTADPLADLVPVTPAADAPTEGRAGSCAPVIRKELRDAVGNRWLIGYAAVLGALGLAATATGLDSTSGLALQAFGRTTATLMNLCLLLAPLVAVLMGAASIAGERDRGTLEHLLAQPLSRAGLLMSKHAGLLIALTLATIAGFLPAGILLVARGGAGMLGHYLLFPAIASLAGAAMAGVGLLISVSSRSAVQAQGAAVFAWFGFVLLYDLVLIGALSLSGMRAEWLAAALVANPVDAARVLGVLALEPDLYLLGPAGAYLAARLSRLGAAVLLLSALAAWTVTPAAIAAMKFALPRRRARRAGTPAHQSLTTAEEASFS